MPLWSPDLLARAWALAAHAHHGQRLPGSELPYVLHPGSVVMEVCAAIAARGGVSRPDLAVACAALHDVVEDTAVGLADIAAAFGDEIAAGVDALTKRPGAGDGPAQLRDSLRRIREQPHEVWMVKLADRIDNLREPPHYWSAEKIAAYREQARWILAELGSACDVLAARLQQRIATYPGPPA